MSDWTAGYVTEIGYTHGYYRDLSPNMISLATLCQSIREHDARPLRYLELGFGQGLSLNIHAAACPGEYWGTDFNPSHAANARRLAEASGSGARIFDLSFEELAARDDLPDFDVITMHGIWSWVSDANRDVIVDFLRRKLTVGGRLYISYNCFPAWAQSIPLRHLLTLHADLSGAAETGIERQIESALTFAQQIADAGGLFFQANPGAKDRLNKLKGEDFHYIAHEYFNRDWQPTPFSAVAEKLMAAKLTYAASGFLQDHVDVVNLTSAGQDLLNGIHHPVLKESARDFLTNRRFRKDIFVRGPLALPAFEQRDLLRQRTFVLVIPAERVPRKQSGPVGELQYPPEVIEPLLAILAQDSHRPKSFAEIEAHPAWANQPDALLRQTLMLLVSSGAVEPAQPAACIAAAQATCRALNRHILHEARYGSDITFLASPVTGGGFALNRYDQLFLAAHEDGQRNAQAMAAYVWAILAAQGVIFMRDGKALATAEENLDELVNAANGFLSQLPLLQTLGIASA